MNHDFKVINRFNGTWTISKPFIRDYEDIFKGYTSIRNTIEYVNEFSKFLDREVFKQDIISYRLNDGWTYGEIANYIRKMDLSDELSHEISIVYDMAQETLDSVKEIVIRERDIRRLKGLIYTTSNMCSEDRLGYKRILTLLESIKDFKNL